MDTGAPSPRPGGLQRLLLAPLLLLGVGLRLVEGCNFDYSLIHCQGQGNFAISCDDGYSIRILSARKRKLMTGTCAAEAALTDSCYSESSAYSTVANACNAKTSCSVDVTRILSYGNAVCVNYQGAFVLHVIFRCEPPALSESIAWTKSICSTQPNSLPWAYIHSQIPNTVSPFIGSTDCLCHIGVPANVEVQIQPRKFSLTKYGTWCGQKIILRDGAEFREFCSQLYDPFIMPCWNTNRTLTLSFRNDDLSILTHFNISIWATTGEPLDFRCGILPTTTTSTTQPTTTTTTTTLPPPTTTTRTTTTTTTSKPTTTTSRTTTSTTTTMPTTTTTTTTTPKPTTTTKTTTTTTKTTTSTTTTKPTQPKSTRTTTETLVPSPSSSLSSKSTTITSTSSSLPVTSKEASSTTTSRGGNDIGGVRTMIPGPDKANGGPSVDESNRENNAIIIGAAAGGLILLVVIVTGTAIACARRRKAAAASAMVVAGGSGRRPHTYETAVHKVPPPPPHGNPYAVPRYGPYGPVDPGGGGGGGVLNDENVYCEIPADHVPEPSPHMVKSKAAASHYPPDSTSTDHIYEEPTYYTMPYDPEPPTLTRIDPQRGTMTVGSRPPPTAPKPDLSNANGQALNNPLFRPETRDGMIFAY